MIFQPIGAKVILFWLSVLNVYSAKKIVRQKFNNELSITLYYNLKPEPIQKKPVSKATYFENLIRKEIKTEKKFYFKIYF